MKGSYAQHDRTISCIVVLRQHRINYLLYYTVNVLFSKLAIYVVQ